MTTAEKVARRLAKVAQEEAFRSLASSTEPHGDDDLGNAIAAAFLDAGLREAVEALERLHASGESEHCGCCRECVDGAAAALAKLAGNGGKP